VRKYDQPFENHLFVVIHSNSNYLSNMRNFRVIPYTPRNGDHIMCEHT